MSAKLFSIIHCRKISVLIFTVLAVCGDNEWLDVYTFDAMVDGVMSRYVVIFHEVFSDQVVRCRAGELSFSCRHGEAVIDMMFPEVMAQNREAKGRICRKGSAILSTGRRRHISDNIGRYWRQAGRGGKKVCVDKASCFGQERKRPEP